MKSSYKIVVYEDEQENAPWEEWIASLRDTRALFKIATRVQRMSCGNFGDHKSLGDGLWELRIDYGPGYRAYYCMEGTRIVLLLCGGDKRKQSDDIRKARIYKGDYERRNV